MWKKIYSLAATNRLVWLVGQFIVLFLCVAYIQHVYVINILPDKEARDLFQPTQCFLISKKLSTKGHIMQRYRADFLISYNVNGVQYNHWVSGNGLDKGFIRNGAEQEDLLSQFEVGGTYPCWYNPESPQHAMLVMRSNWLSTLPILVPSAIGIITLYYFLKTLFRVIDNTVIRSRKRRQVN